jgi:hypothetical protein
MPVTSWSTTAANNNAASPNGAPEGMAPSGVNDVIRQNMADVAREAQINAVKKLNSIAGTNTITADMDPELASYAAGMFVVLTPANNNTGATTLAIDGLTALDILKFDGDALVAGDLVSGVPALLLLDGGADDFYLLNPQTDVATLASGEFTPTLANGANIASSTVEGARWLRVGNTVHVTGSLLAATTATGTTSFTLTLPVASAFTTALQGSGVGSKSQTPAHDSVTIQSESSNDTMFFAWESTSTTSSRLTYSYSYQVI